MTTKHLAKGSKTPPASRDKIRLYSNRFCPYAQRVHLILDAKKLQYERIFINLASKPEWFVQGTPRGNVPTLEIESGDVLNGSLIIANYLDEKYPQNTLHAKDSLQKAKDCMLIEEFNKIIDSMHQVLLTGSASKEDHEDIIRNGLEDFEKELIRRGPYFGGQKPGMVDYMIWPWVERSDLLKLFGNKFLLRKDRYQKLMEWRNVMIEDRAVKKTYLDTDTHIKFLQSLRAGMPEYDLILSSQL